MNLTALAHALCANPIYQHNFDPVDKLQVLSTKALNVFSIACLYSCELKTKKLSTAMPSCASRRQPLPGFRWLSRRSQSSLPKLATPTMGVRSSEHAGSLPKSSFHAHLIHMVECL